MFNTNYALKSYGQCHDEDIRMMRRKIVASDYENDADNEMTRLSFLTMIMSKNIKMNNDDGVYVDDIDLIVMVKMLKLKVILCSRII